MYIELDGDEIAVTYIKDIVFNANRQDVEVLRMTKVLSETLSLQFVLNVVHSMFLACTIVFDLKDCGCYSQIVYQKMSLQCSHLL